jgi:hypothetical protein
LISWWADITPDYCHFYCHYHYLRHFLFISSHYFAASFHDYFLHYWFFSQLIELEIIYAIIFFEIDSH